MKHITVSEVAKFRAGVVLLFIMFSLIFLQPCSPIQNAWQYASKCVFASNASGKIQSMVDSSRFYRHIEFIMTIVITDISRYLSVIQFKAIVGVILIDFVF